MNALLALLAPALAAEPLPPGAPVRIVELGRKDAFWRFRDEIAGLRCRVEEPGLFPNGRRWLGGPVLCEDGQVYYFYQVAAELLPPTTALRIPSPPAPEVAAGLAGEGGLIAPRVAQTAWPPGTRVRVDELSSTDSHYPDRSHLVGRVCVVTDDPLIEDPEGWVGGQLRCDPGGDLFFYQARVSRLTTPASPGAAWPAGRTLKVREVALTDAHYARRGEVEGRVCTVVEDALAATGEGLWAGRLFCEDGRSWQFFKVAVDAAAPPPVPTP